MELTWTLGSLQHETTGINLDPGYVLLLQQAWNRVHGDYSGPRGPPGTGMGLPAYKSHKL
jgi:hypothetical protein